MISLSRWLRRSAAALRLDRRGNVAVMFGLAALPLAGFVGVAIDFSRANAVQTDLQAALDSAALMLSKEAATDTSAQLQTNSDKYFKALFTNKMAKDVQVRAAYTAGSSSLKLDGSASVPMTFMSLMGYDNMTVTGSSTATWGSTRLRVALVLDNTGSMAEDGKMTALKTATKNLLSQLRSAAQVNGDVYVSIVPFSKDVNVGSSNYTANWIDWTEWDAANGNNASTFSGSVCIGGTLYKVVNSGWDSGGRCTGTGPGICYQGTLWKWNGATFFNAGTCSNGTNHANWNGCITDRGPSSEPGNSTYDQTIDPPVSSIRNSLFPAEQYAGCPVAIKGLSYDWTGMDNLVDSMKPNGYTNQPIGLVWGWQSLAGGGPLTAPAKDPGYKYQEIIILLSDGLNTEDRWYVRQTPVDNRMYQTGSGTGTCANIKAAGITIYTIQVNTGGDPTSTLLQNCASSPDKFYELKRSDQIVGAFDTIATKLTQLRIAK